jgi:MFS family permease
MISLFLAIGSLISTSIIDKVGERKSIVFGALACAPWIASLVFAAIKHEFPESNAFLV